MISEMKLERIDLSKYKKKIEKPEKRSLSEYRRDIETCFGTSCNFCEKDCQVYQLKKVKTYTSRGKNRTMLGVLEGKVGYSEELADLFYTCMLCASCDARCAFRNTHRFLEMRREIVRRGLGKKEHKAVVDTIVSKGNMLGDTRSPSNIFEEDLKKAREHARYSVPMFVGCMYKSMPEELRKIISVLSRLGVAVEFIDEKCCGYPVYALGYENEFENVKKNFIESLGKNAENGILTVCPTCTALSKRGAWDKCSSCIRISSRFN
jgi:Fe-S oxidoreductase